MKGSKSLNQHLSCKLGAYVIVHFCFLSFYEFTKNKSKGACRNIDTPALICVSTNHFLKILLYPHAGGSHFLCINTGFLKACMSTSWFPQKVPKPNGVSSWRPLKLYTPP